MTAVKAGRRTVGQPSALMRRNPHHGIKAGVGCRRESYTTAFTVREALVLLFTILAPFPLSPQLEPFVEAGAIICLQEMSLLWTGRMQCWFEARGYSLVSNCYGNVFNGI